MRKLTLLTILFLTVLSTPVFADWTKVSEGVNGDTFYVDFERIRKHGGYVYYWRLSDYLEPNKYGNLSAKVYFKGDCKLFRVKYLSFSLHKEPMGGGKPSTSSNKPDKEWQYPPPDSVIETVLKLVCEYAN